MLFRSKNNKLEIHEKFAEPWRVTLVDTGLDTMTGGRLKRVSKYIDDETFCFTYGDGLANVKINELIDFHKSNRKLATVTAVQQPGRFGRLNLKKDSVTGFEEKPSDDGTWINGGFFVLQNNIFDYIENDSTVWERGPLEKLADQNQLCAFIHSGFWSPLDTLREKNHLESLWGENKAPWKIW